MKYRYSILLMILQLAGSTVAWAQSSGVSRVADQRARTNHVQRADRLVNDQHYSRLRIAKKELVEVQTDSLYLDTLIMEDKASLRFVREAVVIVEHAYVGKECLVSSAGLAGAGAGSSGESGRKLSLVVIFESLGTLTIDTRGGDGVAGETGDTASDLQGTLLPGGQGGPGGDGGQGGDLKLMYSAEGFIPVFNESREHGIHLKYQGGKAGGGGLGGLGAGG